MEIKKFQIGAELEGFSLKKDGSASIRFGTGELSVEDVVVIKQFFGKYGYMLFRENQFATEEVPKEDAEFGRKSDSERLRNVLYLVWESKGKPDEFEKYRHFNMEKVIDHFKNKLPQKK